MKAMLSASVVIINRAPMCNMSRLFGLHGAIFHDNRLQRPGDLVRIRAGSCNFIWAEFLMCTTARTLDKIASPWRHSLKKRQCQN